MSKINIYCLPGSTAVAFAGRFLEESGISVFKEMSPQVTHLLCPVPTRSPVDAPEGITVIGGNIPAGIDLLRDPFYLTENAAITARCAISLIGMELKGLPVLVLGWGRIGKCLGKFLADAGAEVTIAARKPEDVAMIRALGYKGMFIQKACAQGFGAVLNTVPAMVLDASGADCLLMELASQPGITGDNILDARGLPGKYASEESGRLIAETILRILKEEEE